MMPTNREEDGSRLDSLCDDFAELGEILASPAAMSSPRVCELAAALLAELRAESERIVRAE